MDFISIHQKNKTSFMPKYKLTPEVRFSTTSILDVQAFDMTEQTLNAVYGLTELYQDKETSDHCYDRGDILDLNSDNNRQLRKIQARLRNSKAMLFRIIH